MPPLFVGPVEPAAEVCYLRCHDFGYLNRDPCRGQFGLKGRGLLLCPVGASAFIVGALIRDC